MSAVDSARLLAEASPRPWYYDGRDIFSEGFQGGGHRLVIPLPRTFHPSQEVSEADAQLVVLAVNAYDAVAGRVQQLEAERDRLQAWHDKVAPLLVPTAREAELKVVLARKDEALRRQENDWVFVFNTASDPERLPAIVLEELARANLKVVRAALGQA